MPQLIKDYVTLRENLPPIKKMKQESIGFVPTMGALHDGHLSLIGESKKQCDLTVASVFVNPIQFGPEEDLEAYPRALEEDFVKLEKIGVDILYAPSVDEMYPEGFQTLVGVGPIGEGLCGEKRPGHFDGVCTVVCKLLLHVIPDKAFFGEKDYQQLKVIQRMVEDLSIPSTIVPVPTHRQIDGLAMSSRNRYLNEKERALAPSLYRELLTTADKIKAGGKIANTIAQAKENLTSQGFRLDYLEYRDANDLTTLTHYQSESRLFVAAYLGRTRLIDNIAVE